MPLHGAQGGASVATVLLPIAVEATGRPRPEGNVCSEAGWLEHVPTRLPRITVTKEPAPGIAGAAFEVFQDGSVRHVVPATASTLVFAAPFRCRPISLVVALWSGLAKEPNQDAGVLPAGIAGNAEPTSRLGVPPPPIGRGDPTGSPVPTVSVSSHLGTERADAVSRAFAGKLSRTSSCLNGDRPIAGGVDATGRG